MTEVKIYSDPKYCASQPSVVERQEFNLNDLKKILASQGTSGG
jgi:hypothetical protein